MLHSKTVEAIVGVFIALGLGALVVLALKVSNLSTMYTGPSYEVTAQFGNVGGLKVRSPVKMAGVVVGRVADISFDQKTYEAVATLRIEDKYNEIPVDSTANIFTSGLLGEQYVSLDPGGSETFLKNGDRIKLTQSAVVLERLIGQFLYNKAAGGDSGSK